MMKQLFAISIFLFAVFSCSSRPESTNKETPVDTLSNVGVQETQSAQTVVEAVNITFLTSTYDDSNSANTLVRHREGLKTLSDGKFFASVHSRLFPTLTKKHQRYFEEKPHYQLLHFAKGALFQNIADDHTFVVYDQNNQRILILVYSELAGTYYELFKDMKVVNGLESANCNYGAFGTLDYQIAEELIYQGDYLIKKPEDIFESPICIITDITKDDSLPLEDGCFSPNISYDKSENSLCISTSSVYNNWECMQFNEAEGHFVIFYGQAFAD